MNEIATASEVPAACRIAAGSCAPTARPTRTAAAIEIPIGTMNVRLATLSATWCPASCVVPIRPMSRPTRAKTPTSSRYCAPIGAPSATKRRSGRTANASRENGTSSGRKIPQASANSRPTWK